MRIALSALRPFHFVMLAHALRAHADRIDIYSSAPRRFFKGLDESIRTRMVPAPFQIGSYFSPFRKHHNWMALDTFLYDFTVASLMGKPAVCFGLAVQCQYTARASKRRGGLFVLDRACPHL